MTCVCVPGPVKASTASAGRLEVLFCDQCTQASAVCVMVCSGKLRCSAVTLGRSLCTRAIVAVLY